MLLLNQDFVSISFYCIALNFLNRRNFSFNSCTVGVKQLEKMSACAQGVRIAVTHEVAEPQIQLHYSAPSPRLPASQPHSLALQHRAVIDEVIATRAMNIPNYFSGP